MVSLVPNPEKFEDIYPEETDDEDSDEPEEDVDNSAHEDGEIKAIRKEIWDNERAIQEANEEKASAASVYAMLEHYANSMQDRPANLEQCLTAYIEQRSKAFKVHSTSDTKLKALQHESKRLAKKLSAALHATVKEKRKLAKERRKALEKKKRAQQEEAEAKKRLKQSRIEFWPRKTYQVVLSLDTNSDMTPTSSRRGSVDTLMEKPLSDDVTSCQISLSLTYITDSAFWYPRYDLNLETPTSTGLITYRAEYCNTTSETWKDTKMTLSTSHTSFQGLGEPIPSMQPWHIRLMPQKKPEGGLFGGLRDPTNGALFSCHEMQKQSNLFNNNGTKVSEPRWKLFGLGDYDESSSTLQFIRPMAQQQQEPIQQAQMQSIFLQQQQQRQQQLTRQDNQKNPFGSLNTNSQVSQQRIQGGGLFGNSNTNSQSGGLFGSSNANTGGSGSTNVFGSASNTVEDPVDPSEESSSITIPDLPSLSTQEAEWAETGMTATYEIPGKRTIAPSHTARRHNIASITLKAVHLSYFIIPKLRAAAFLKARIRNTSSISLLKGPAGLTLDGSFLGNTSIPRCSAGEPFSLSLGVDPSVSVAYAKPVVKRSQTGVFQREGTGVYTRQCTITNTKSNRAIEGVVLDQIPVSEDDRLKVDILQPSGLRNEGDTAKTGTGVPAAGKVTEKWGTARATLKKAGEVTWNVDLEPGRGARLPLEYEARFPPMEAVVSC